MSRPNEVCVSSTHSPADTYQSHHWAKASSDAGNGVDLYTYTYPEREGEMQ